MDYANTDTEYEMLAKLYGGLLSMSPEWQSSFPGEIQSALINSISNRLNTYIDTGLPKNHAGLLQRLIPHVRLGVVENQAFSATTVCGNYGLYAYINGGVWSTLESLFTNLCEIDSFREHSSIQQLTLSSTESKTNDDQTVDQAMQIVRLAALVWEFVLTHEIGHLLGGHLAYFIRAGIAAEFAESNPPDDLPDDIPFQEAELDADRFAIEVICRRLQGLTHQKRTVRDDHDIALLLYLSISIVSYILVNLKTRSATGRHPSPPARLLYAATIIHNELQTQPSKGRSISASDWDFTSDIYALLSQVPGMLEGPSSPLPVMEDKDAWWGPFFQIRNNPAQSLIPGKYELLKVLEARICGDHH